MFFDTLPNGMRISCAVTKFNVTQKEMSSRYQLN